MLFSCVALGSRHIFLEYTCYITHRIVNAKKLFHMLASVLTTCYAIKLQKKKEKRENELSSSGACYGVRGVMLVFKGLERPGGYREED